MNFKIIRSFSAFVALVLISTSCKNNKAKKENLVFEEAYSIFMPVYLQENKSSILLTEFFEDSNAVDSVNSVGAVKIIYKKGESKVSVETNAASPKIFTLNVYSKGMCKSIVCKKTTRQTIAFEYKESAVKYKQIKVKGEFNNWNTEATTLSLAGNVWKGELNINPGKYNYKLMGDGKEISDHNNSDSVSNGMGGYNNILTVEAADRSKLPELSTQSFDNNNITIKCTNSPEAIICLWQNQIMSHELSNGNCILTVPDIAQKVDRSFIRVFAYNSEGISNDILIPLENGKVLENTTSLNRNDKEYNIMYFALVDRFVDGDTSNTRKTIDKNILPRANYYGGDLQGLINKINDGYLEKLGVNCLWISPIVQNPLGAYQEYPAPRRWFSGYHGYWPVTETTIDTRFGNDDVFKNLVTTAHQKKMNVLLDFVSNHVHSENKIYKDHPEFFTSIDLPDGRKNIRLWDEYRLTTWFEPFMPDINYDIPQAVDMMTDSALYWITKFGIDGFRHDAVKHVPSPFWLTLTKKIKQQVVEKEHRSIYQIGETFGSRELIGSYVSTGQLDAQFDFNTYFDASRILLNNDESFESLKNSITESCNYYGYHHLMGNISGNHDMPRFISFASKAISGSEDAKEAGWTRDVKIKDSVGYDMLIQLQALNMTLPGVPCIYYGDEYGDMGAGDPDNRRMARFGNMLSSKENNTLDKTIKLVQLRRNNIAMIYGETKFLQADKNVLVIMRKYFEQVSILILNKSNDIQTATFEMPDYTNSKSLKALFDSNFEISNGKMVMQIPPHQTEVLYSYK